MKKALSFFMSVVIIVSCFSMFGLHAEAFTGEVLIENVNVSGEQGSQIKIPVKIKNNTGLMGFKLNFDYDEKVLTPIAVEYGDLFSGGLQDNIEGDSIPGSFCVYWAGYENMSDDGILFYVVFQIKNIDLESYEGSFQTKINVTSSQSDTFDENFNDVAIRPSNFYVNFRDADITWYYNEFLTYNFSGEKIENVNTGDNFLVKLGNASGSNDADDLLYFTINIKYDVNNFEFVGWSNSNGELYEDISVVNNGNITVSYDGQDESDIIVKDHTNPDVDIYDDANSVFAGMIFMFKAKENCKNGNYDFEVSCYDYNVDYCSITDYSINVSSNNTTKIHSNVVSASYGEELSIPIYITNNNGLMGYCLEFTYDQEILNPISVSSGENFNGTISDSIGIKEGEFKVVWNTTENNYNDGVLLVLKFDVLEQMKTDSSILVSYSQPDTFNEAYEDVTLNCNNIELKLNDHKHSYTAVVTNPTCTEKGYTTYTCTCGDYYISDEIEPLGHDFGEWVYNGDAEYTSSSNNKNGTQTRVCKRCGKEETIEAVNTGLLANRGNALALESSITLTTYITKNIVDYYDDVYAEFTRNQKSEIVYASEKTLISGSTVYNIFEYKGIPPQAMGDDIKITFYGVKNGVKYWGDTYVYSVTDYVKSTLSKSTTSEKLKTMLVDLMYYGAACQIYQNYKTNDLMTDILTDEQKQSKSSYSLNLNNIKDSSYSTCPNRLVQFGTALRLNNAVEMALALNMSNVTVEDLSFKVKIGNREQTYSYAENPENFEKRTDGYWYFYFDGVYANQMSDAVFITAYKDQEQVSNTLKYSVESYASIVTDAKLKAVTDAMMYYGNSARIYSGK